MSIMNIIYLVLLILNVILWGYIGISLLVDSYKAKNAQIKTLKSALDFEKIVNTNLSKQLQEVKEDKMKLRDDYWNYKTLFGLVAEDARIRAIKEYLEIKNNNNN